MTDSDQPSPGTPAEQQWAGRVRRFGPVALIGLMLAVAVALGLAVFDFGVAPVAHPLLPLLALAGVWLALELVVLHVQFGKSLDNAEQLTLSEIALCLGLLFSVPTSLIVAGLASSVLLDLLRWRKKTIKVVFNAANRAMETTVALAVYQALAPADPLSAQGWAALGLAATVSSLVSALNVAGVISLSIGGLPGREFLSHVLISLPIAVTCATVAFVAGLALQTGSPAVAPLLVTFVVLLALMRSFSLLTERHLNLASLHGLGGRLASAEGVRPILASTLEAAADLLIARDVEVFVPIPQDPSHLLRVHRDVDGVLSEQVVSREVLPSGRGLLGDTGTLVAAAPVAPGQEVLFAATGRAEPMRPFSLEDARLLDMVAHQTGANLHTAQLIEQLRLDALRDPLTGLLNRRAVLDLTHELVTRRQPVALVWLDVDIQGVNAALGHARGDELLVQVAGRLRALCGAESVGRVGGQEFALVLGSGPDRLDVARSVESVLASLQKPFPLSGVEVLTRPCVGVAEEAGRNRAAAADLLRRADIALRHAQRTGRPVEHYTTDLETTSPERLALATDLQGGIARDELTLYAQPQVRLTDGAVAGVEMLVRWNHPRLGLLSPADFIPLAEQTGLDRALTAWVVGTSLRTLAGWRASGLWLSVSVNVTAGALDSLLVGQVDELLHRHRIPGRDLILEVTESSLLTNITRAAEVLHSLSALGVRVSIDDFGTGFSSLSHLRSLPVDEIKVDQSFIRTMMGNRDDAAVVRSVITLGQGLGLSVVAEGIETEQVYTALKQLGCDLAQGYHMARPMPAEDIPGWLVDAPAGPARPGHPGPGVALK